MSKRRRKVLLIGALVVALGGLVAVDRVMVAVVGVGPLSVFRPPLIAVRDGWIAGGERNAAMAEVRDFSPGLALSGATPVATVVDTTCVEGQSNFMRHDSYRLSCAASVRLFQAWSGDFDAMRTQVRAALGARCSGPVPEPLESIPRRGSDDQVAYQCGSGLKVRLGFGTTDGLTTEDAALQTGQDSDETRHVSGPSATELVDQLAGNHWFVLQETRKIYFQDRP